MTGKLYPSKDLQRIINNYHPLTQEQSDKWVKQYMKTGSEKSANAIINGISRLFAKVITKNDRKFVIALGEDITYDDIFNQMTVMVLKGIKQGKYDVKKSKLNTWAQWAIMPLVITPVKVMGDKFISVNRGNITNIDAKFKGSEDGTLGDILPDDSVDVQKDYTTDLQNDKLDKAIKKLTKDQQQIILTLFGYIPIKKQWQSKTGKVNAASIGRGLGIQAAKMRGIIEKILQKLRNYLKQSKYDKYHSLDRLIQMYSGKRKFYKSALLNKRQWDLL